MVTPRKEYPRSSREERLRELGSILSSLRLNAKAEYLDFLSEQEYRCVREHLRGMQPQEIAAILCVDKSTEGGIKERIRGKLGLRSRAEIIAWAVVVSLNPTVGGPNDEIASKA